MPDEIGKKRAKKASLQEENMFIFSLLENLIGENNNSL